MKTLYTLAILLLGGTIFAQSTDELLASNELNAGKAQQTVVSVDFPQMEVASLDGIYKLVDAEGNLQEVRTFKKGMLDGTWLQYDENENLIAIANYKDDRKHGKWVIWDSNGTKRYELFYTEGERSGTWRSWNETGELMSTKTY
jgi:antitoxin component YwqK of YwqJK toxin-antitoxin module